MAGIAENQWHEPYICHVYDMNQWYEPYICYLYDMIASLCELITRAIYLSYIWHDSFIWDVRHLYVWIMYDMIHMNVSRHTRASCINDMSHISVIYMTWFIYLCHATLIWIMCDLIYMNASRHTCESRTYMRASCHALWMHHVIHMNGFWHTWTQVIERDIFGARVERKMGVHCTHVNTSCHTYESLSHIWMSHTYKCATSHILMGHVTHMNESRHVTHMNTGDYFSESWV